MKLFGVALICAGLALIGWAFVMNVAIDPAPMDGRLDLIANNDLMNQRLMFAVVGSAVFLSGWLALILDRITAPSPKAGDAKLYAEQVG